MSVIIPSNIRQNKAIMKGSYFLFGRGKSMNVYHRFQIVNCKSSYNIVASQKKLRFSGKVSPALLWIFRFFNQLYSNIRDRQTAISCLTLLAILSVWFCCAPVDLSPRSTSKNRSEKETNFYYIVL